MTKILNIALKIKGDGREGGRSEVLRPCHPPKFGTCTRMTSTDAPLCYVYRNFGAKSGLYAVFLTNILKNDFDKEKKQPCIICNLSTNLRRSSMLVISLV